MIAIKLDLKKGEGKVFHLSHARFKCGLPVDSWLYITWENAEIIENL